MTSTAFVTLEAVIKQFNGAPGPAIKELSAQIWRGRITGLVGPDGAGKTTLIRLMAGLLAPSSGIIQVDGLDPIRSAPCLRDAIGYMPQKFGLYEDLTVQENLDLHADLRGLVNDKRIQTFERLLAFTDLGSFTRRFAGKLSGGMKQKLGLACALLGQPRLLLLDEPSVGVDPISRRELWKMVNDLAEQGMTVIWSTAYLDEAELCHHVLLLNEGQLLFHGQPAEMSQRLQGRSFQIRSISKGRRQVLATALNTPAVLDGVIQGHNIRLLFNADVKTPNVNAFNAGNQAELVPVLPNFEDAFIDALGGGSNCGHSELASRLHPIGSIGESVIEAVQLTKVFGDFTATDHIDFTVKQGEIFGLLGPNGAGKSTTFRMMCGLLKPSSGSARILNIDLTTRAGLARQQIGYMAQKFSLYGSLTVKQNLKFFSGVYGLTGTRQKLAIESMIEAFKLQTLINSKPDKLPLGYQQRLALACAIMHEPAILFLDEPTSGVDPVTRREFWWHINSMVEKGMTVMVTTHFMDEAEYCDRIGLVFRGKMIATGTPDQLKSQITSPSCPDPTLEDAFIALVQNAALADNL